MLRSIRARLTLAAALSTVVVLAIVWTLIGVLFEDHIERLLEDDIENRLDELSRTIRLDENDRPILTREPTDPRYRVLSGGAYWRIEKSPAPPLRSLSLEGSDFSPSPRLHLSPRALASEWLGPNGSIVYLAQRDLLLDGPKGRESARVSVAVDTSAVLELRRSFANQVFVALGIIAVALSLGAWVQSSFALRPLRRVREQLARIHDGSDMRMTGELPMEVAPLVQDLNDLLSRQEQLVRRARERAGDLAHGLKTPLTIVEIEARNAERRGDVRAAKILREQVEVMNRHVDRELRRARMAGPTVGGTSSVDVHASVDRLVRALSRLPGAERIAWENALPLGELARMDPDDFGEIAGNLLDNARKYARSRVRISTRRIEETIMICVDDDGPGIPEEERPRVLQRGETAAADGDDAGLGLSIVMEALSHYGATLTIEHSSFGGCRMSFPIRERAERGPAKFPRTINSI